MRLQQILKFWVLGFCLLVSLPLLAQTIKLDDSSDLFRNLMIDCNRDPKNFEKLRALTKQAQVYTLDLGEALRNGDIDSYRYTRSLIYVYNAVAEGHAHMGNRELALNVSDAALAYARDTSWEIPTYVSRYSIFSALGEDEEALLSLMRMADSPLLGQEDGPEGNLTTVVFLAEVLAREDRLEEALHYYEVYFEKAVEIRRFGHTKVMPYWKRYKKVAKELGIKVKRKDFFEKEIKTYDADSFKYAHPTKEQQLILNENLKKRKERETMIFDENRKAAALAQKAKRSSH